MITPAPPPRTYQVMVTSEDRTPPGVITHRDEFDFAILTVPPATCSQIKVNPSFSADRLRIDDGPAVKFFSRYTKRFWLDDHLAPNAKWHMLGSVWKATDNQGDQGDFCPAVFSVGPYMPRESEYPGRFAALYPKGRATGTRFADWQAWPNIKSGYAYPAVRSRSGPGE